MIRLALRVARADAELVLAELLALAPAGVEEIDHGDTIEYAVYGAPGELPALPALRAAAGAALVDIATTQIADDWDTRWRTFHRPVTIGGRLHVRPPWTDAVGGDPRLLEIVVDPAQAFGTGAHPTTRLCLEALLELAPGGGPRDPAPRDPPAARAGLADPAPRGGFLDLGCGSGVLAIAAAKLGWEPVLGLDHERESVRATLDNAAANGVTVAARGYDLLRDGPPASAPTVAANLLRPLLLHVARSGFAGAPPRVLVAGGLLEAEADEVAAAFAESLGLRERARRADGGWAALTLAR